VASKELNILEFVTDLDLLKGSELSLAQRTILKTIYGLELDLAELDIYRRGTGRKIYEPSEHNEATVIVGRRGGKTSRIGAIVPVYEASRDHEITKRTSVTPLDSTCWFTGNGRLGTSIGGKKTSCDKLRATVAKREVFRDVCRILAGVRACP